MDHKNSLLFDVVFPEAKNNGPVMWMHFVTENTMSNERVLQSLLFKLKR